MTLGTQSSRAGSGWLAGGRSRPLIRHFPAPWWAGWATFKWLEDQRFLIQRSHYDHPGIPAHGAGELSRDNGATWEHDLAIAYRRIG